MLYSAVNVGKFKAFDVYLSGLWGWRISAIIGLVLQGILIFLFPKMFSFVEKGTVNPESMI